MIYVKKISLLGCFLIVCLWLSCQGESIRGTDEESLETGSPNTDGQYKFIKTITLAGHIGRLLNATFSLDGKKIVTASSDNTGGVWFFSC